MTLGTLLVGMAVLVLCIPFVIRPFLTKNHKTPLPIRKEPVSLQKKNSEEHRQRILSALSELDFDYQTGKVAEDDHLAMRTRLLAEAAELMEKQSEEDEKIEALVRARREALSNPATCSQCGESIKPTDRFCLNCGASSEHQDKKETAASFCPACGSKIVAEAKFCSSCGERIAVP